MADRRYRLRRSGLRDRAIMEVFYATAMRRGELAGIDLADVDLARRWVTLRDTKTRWDRVVPTGERAAAWITRYLTDARPHLAVGTDEGALFLGADGQRLGGRVVDRSGAALHRGRRAGKDRVVPPVAPHRRHLDGRARGGHPLSSRSCSATGSWPPPRSTPGSPRPDSPPSTKPPTPALPSLRAQEEMVTTTRTPAPARRSGPARSRGAPPPVGPQGSSAALRITP